MGVELAVVGTEEETDAGIEAAPAETDTKTGGRQTADGSVSGRNIRGRLDYAALEREITPGTRAVIVTHASNLTGNLTDIRRIGEMCRRAGALFIVDASQTAGIFPIDMERDCIDVLCFTGHKSLMGPQGTGGICVRKGLEIRPLKSGGSGILTFSKTHPSVMPAALEAGTLNAVSYTHLDVYKRQHLHRPASQYGKDHRRPVLLSACLSDPSAGNDRGRSGHRLL